MMKKVLLFLLVLTNFTALAQLKVANIFGDHMVLQRDKPIKIWGWNDARENVIVDFNGQSYTTITNADGSWDLRLDALSAGGGALILTVKDADESVEFVDILMGEVWLCSGQSNMEWKLRSVDNAAEEIKNANHPNIRHIEIPKATSFEKLNEFEDREWQISTPETAGGFTAVGYFFARKLVEELDVPVGLVHSSWGGSHVETWISKEAMLNSEVLKEYAEQMPDNWDDDAKKWEKLTIERFHGDKDFDVSTLNESDYLSSDYDFSNWTNLNPMGQWDWKGVPNFRGTVYIQKDIEISEEEAASTSEINFGVVSSNITFYINGNLVNSGYHSDQINFELPAGSWKEGSNSLLVKFSENTDPAWRGVGLYGGPNSFNLKFGETNYSLMGEAWKTRPSWDSPRHYEKRMNNEGTLCYNAMIAPLVGLSMQGAIWYQGESNSGRAYQYRTSFPMMINDWRAEWEEDFSFLWVQLATYGPTNDSNTGSNWAELREAQTMTLSLAKTGQAITTDVGNPGNIHPTNKQDVGLRLALSALNVTYEKDLVYSGPTYKSMKVKKGKVTLSFDNIGTGLKTTNKYGNLEGFEIAGEDQKFYFAQSVIEGNNVVVSHPDVSKPVSVRFAWSNSPIDANLFNKEGLPATPFRTDTWKGVTEDGNFE